MGLTTFISQNLGAKKYDRAKKGARIGILCSISMAEIVGIIVYFASPVFIAAFNNDPKVIAFGVKEAHIITLFYFLLAFSTGIYFSIFRLCQFLFFSKPWIQSDFR